MLWIFQKKNTLRRWICVILIDSVLLLGVTAQTRTVYTFEDKEVIPSYEDLKNRLDRISSETIAEYRLAVRIADETKAEAILEEIGKDVIMTHRLSNCPEEAKESGWSDKQYRMLPKLINKRDNILRRLKKIQEDAKRASHPGSPFFLKEKAPPGGDAFSFGAP